MECGPAYGYLQTTVDKEHAQELTQRFSRRTVEVISPAELTAKLTEGRPLRIKLGMDPTAPDLHLGHTITLKAMREFQEAGHTVIFLVGDFTAAIGDPTGRSETRKPLDRDQIKLNAETYKHQVFKVLDPARTEIRFNSEWMDQLNLRELIKIAAHISVARLLERDDFEQRLAAQQPLYLHELLYPLIQGYDSVAIKADVELGGTDQKFNMLLGRELQRAYGQPPQLVMTFPLLEGLDGVRKMSKSLGNYVGVTEAPREMFGKLMSVSDTMMLRYYELLTDLEPAEIASIKRHAVHPMEAKKRLAGLIVEEYHDAGAARAARQHFRDPLPEARSSSRCPSLQAGRRNMGLRTDEAAQFRPFHQRSAPPHRSGRGAGRRRAGYRPQLPFRSRPQPPARSWQAAHRQDRALAAHHQSNAGNGDQGNFKYFWVLFEIEMKAHRVLRFAEPR